MTRVTGVAEPPAPDATRLTQTSADWSDRARVAPCVAVVVNYRCEQETVGCVASLRRCAPDVPVLVVDNDADDRPRAALAVLCSDAATALVVTGNNSGFGGGCNAGIAAALQAVPHLEHVLLINPDARATAGLVEALRATARQHEDAGIVGGRILSADGTRVQFENGRLRPWTLTRMHCRAPAGDAEFETTFVTGALMLVDAEMLRSGLRFDERYFLYVEDVDLCCEVRDRGRTLWINPSAVVHHRGGGAFSGETPVLGGLTRGQIYWLARSKVVFARKRLGRGQRLVHLAVAAILKPVAGLLRSPRGRFLAAHFRGLRDGLRQPLM